VHFTGEPFCAQISFVFYCFEMSYFFYKNVSTLNPDLHHNLKCAYLSILLLLNKNSISPKISLTTLLHSHDDLCTLAAILFFGGHFVFGGHFEYIMSLDVIEAFHLWSEHSI
jgi:hypothetical protein